MTTGQKPRHAVSRIPADGGHPCTPDVELAPLAPEHAGATAGWTADPVVARGIGLRTTPTVQSTREWIERAVEDPAVQPFAVLAGGQHVGNVVLDMVDAYLGTARLSIYVGKPEARGAGVAQRAIGSVVAYAAGELRLHKLWLIVHTANAPAIAAYERCGFVAEGVLRDEFLLDGERADVVRMGLILDDRGT